MWVTGIILFLLLMVISFLGYILPWGQMSYWGAVVITNLISVIPFFGKSIIAWLWGGFSISNPTLNRFFILHYILPFLLLGISFLHIFFLHTVGSKNPINVESWNCSVICIF
jgi:ubiquinol-cytochrome c reductase cytochrome b subunit